jgi:general secretion pathway protein H
MEFRGAKGQGWILTAGSYSLLVLLPIGRKYGGFTLIELLVVIVILGILASVTVLTIGDGRTEVMKKEVNKLFALINLAEEEAILQNKEIGLLVTHTEEIYGYSFLSFNYEDQAWQPIENNTFRCRTLPDDITLSVELENTRTGADKSQSIPQILLLSTGEKSSSFSLVIQDTQSPGFVAVLSSNGLNKTELTISQPGG